MQLLNFHYKNFIHKLFSYILFSLLILLIQIPKIKIIFHLETLSIQKIDNNKTTNSISAFPIDIVYTWVDGRDKKWLDEFKKAKEEKQIRFNKNDFLNRYVDIEELRYSLRSVEKNAPWANSIYIVTWNQIPYWINKDHPKIKFISHSQIFPENITMPTFNSNSIEFLLYKIPGLSEHFIYFNDDMYFGQPVKPSDFFTLDGKNIIISNTVSWSNIDYYNKEWRQKSKFKPNGEHLFNVFTTNTISLFIKKYHQVFPYEYSHVPFPLTKTIFRNAYLNFQKEIERTIENRFRNVNDLHMQTLMIQYGIYMNQSIRVKKDNNKAMFIVSEGKNNNFLQLSKITYNTPKLLSINVDENINRDSIKGLLDFLFDSPSSFELPDKLPDIRPEYKKNWIKYYDKHMKIANQRRLF